MPPIIIPLNQYTGGPVNIPTAMPARLQRQDLINPAITQRSWFGEPYNALPYMKYPDMIEAATKGLSLGRQIAALPLNAREQATQYAIQGIAQAKVKDIQQQLKDIQAGKGFYTDQNGQTVPAQSDAEKTLAHNQVLNQMIIGPQGVTIDPVLQYQRQLAIQREQQGIRVTQKQKPYLVPKTTTAGTDTGGDGSKTGATDPDSLKAMYTQNPKKYQLDQDGTMADVESGQVYGKVRPEDVEGLLKIRRGEAAPSPSPTATPTPTPGQTMLSAPINNVAFMGNYTNPAFAPISSPYDYSTGGSAPSVPMLT